MPGSALAGTIEDLAAVGPEDLARSVSVADITSSHAVIPEDAVDQLAAHLAALCLDRLERRVCDENYEMGATDAFKGKLQVGL